MCRACAYVDVRSCVSKCGRRSGEGRGGPAVSNASNLNLSGRYTKLRHLHRYPDNYQWRQQHLKRHLQELQDLPSQTRSTFRQRFSPTKATHMLQHTSPFAYYQVCVLIPKRRHSIPATHRRRHSSPAINAAPHQFCYLQERIQGIQIERDGRSGKEKERNGREWKEK